MINKGNYLKRLCLFLAVLLAAPMVHADFGEYQSHHLSGQTLTITSTAGELHISAVDDAAFEVHYVEDGVKQLPSFAIEPK